MTREDAISIIEALYPADSTYPENSQVGQELLAQAKREVHGWRTEPTEVLIRYADLCVQREQKLDNQRRREALR